MASQTQDTMVVTSSPVGEAPITTRRLDSLTGLRFVAAFVVFGRHSGIGRAFTEQGATGVSFFFILSGFVLAWSSRPNDGSRAFYRRRAARVLPAYWVAWVIGLVITYAEVGGWRGSLPGLPLLQAWFPSRSVYFGGNGVGWSLSVETFFYLCFPVLIVAFGRMRSRSQWIWLAVVLGVAIVWPLIAHPADESGGVGLWAIYINPLARITEFIAGLLVALRIRDGWRSPVPLAGAACIAAMAYLAAGWVPGYAMWVAVTVIPYTLLIASAATTDIEGRRSWARARWLVVLGQWSFAFYLVHQLVMRALLLAVPSAIHGGQQVALDGTSLVVSILAAGLLFTFVEKPLEGRLRGDRALPISEGGVGHATQPRPSLVDEG